MTGNKSNLFYTIRMHQMVFVHLPMDNQLGLFIDYRFRQFFLVKYQFSNFQVVHVAINIQLLKFPLKLQPLFLKLTINRLSNLPIGILKYSNLKLYNSLIALCIQKIQANNPIIIILKVHSLLNHLINSDKCNSL